MTDNYKYRLTSKNFAFLLIATMQEVTILQLPGKAAEFAGNDAWLSILLASIPAFVSLFLILKICARYPRLSLGELNDEVCGVYIGKFLSLAYILYAVANAAVIIRLFSEVVSSFLLVRTPCWILTLVMVLTVTYIFSRDIRAIAWMNEFTQYLLLAFFLLFIFLVSKADYHFLLPIGDAGVKNILLGTQGAFFNYISPEILLVVYPFIENKKEILKAGSLAVLFSVVTYTLITIFVIINFGGTLANIFVWDFLDLIKSYQLPLVERSEFFTAIFWSWIAIRSSSNELFMARHTLAKAAGISGKYLTYIILALAGFVYGLTLIPETTSETQTYASMVGFAGMFFMLGLPVILWAVSALRGVRET